MPALSPTMEHGKIMHWIKKEGENVSSGDVIAEIETDKAIMEFESAEDGIMGKILVPEGTENVKVNSIIAVLLSDGEDVGAIQDVDLNNVTHNQDNIINKVEISEALVQTQDQSLDVISSKNASNIKSSPIAKKIASDNNINLSKIVGSGPYGRIVKQDVMHHLSEQEVETKSIDTSAGYTCHDITGVRKVIASRLTESKQTIPHFYVTLKLQLDNLLKLKREISASGIKITVNDFFVKASALALMDCPGVNSSWCGDHIKQYNDAHVCVAVSVDGAILVPVVRNANHKSLSAISTEIKSLVSAAKGSGLRTEQMSGGTFTISNMGMYKVEEFKAIINPPQAAILAIGSGSKIPFVGEDNAINVGTFCSVTISADHRVIDGAIASEFLGGLCHYIENPLSMLI